MVAQGAAQRGFEERDGAGVSGRGLVRFGAGVVLVLAWRTGQQQQQLAAGQGGQGRPGWDEHGWREWPGGSSSAAVQGAGVQACGWSTFV